MNPASLGCVLLYILRALETRYTQTSCQLQIPRVARDDNLGNGTQAMDDMQTDATIREALPSESAIILHHRRSMFRDMGEGTVEELDRMVEVARPWLARGLADGSCHHWLALDAAG